MCEVLPLKHSQSNSFISILVLTCCLVLLCPTILFAKEIGVGPQEGSVGVKGPEEQYKEQQEEESKEEIAFSFAVYPLEDTVCQSFSKLLSVGVQAILDKKTAGLLREKKEVGEVQKELLEQLPGLMRKLGVEPGILAKNGCDGVLVNGDAALTGDQEGEKHTTGELSASVLEDYHITEVQMMAQLGKIKVPTNDGSFTWIADEDAAIALLEGFGWQANAEGIMVPNNDGASESVGGAKPVGTPGGGATVQGSSR